MCTPPRAGKGMARGEAFSSYPRALGNRDPRLRPPGRNLGLMSPRGMTRRPLRGE